MDSTRPSTSADPVLVKVYEDLADEDESIRLKAAHALLVNYVSKADATQQRSIVTRLFRGLCSGRKAARIGFAIGLTESLVQLSRQPEDGYEAALSAAHIIDILERSTKPDSNVSGQDERDHYFGRVFGCDAIINSGILFTEQYSGQWDRLLDIMCAVALQKPWLRQTCGWILYSTVVSTFKSSSNSRYAVRILEKLKEHKLIRTPEGLAIWVAMQSLHPGVKCPDHVWKHDDPFYPKNLPTLANVLKDARVDAADGAEMASQGSAMWNASLHFVWDIVLTELWTEGSKGGIQQKQYFEKFWQVAVDDALFAPSNSQERKQWGLLVMQKVLKMAPPDLIEAIYSKKAVSCLIHSIKATDKYLQRSAQLVMQQLQDSVIQQPLQADKYILSFLKATDMADVDKLTQTRSIENALTAAGPEALTNLAAGLSHELEQQEWSEHAEVKKRLTNIVSLESKILAQHLHLVLTQKASLNEQPLRSVLSTWFKLISSKTTNDENFGNFVLEKTRSTLEQVLKLDRQGRIFILDLVDQFHTHNTIESLGAEASIVDIINAGWSRFRKLYKELSKQASNGHLDDIQSQRSSKKPAAEKTEGLALLFGLILFEIHSGDTEAIQVLQELLEVEANQVESRKRKRSEVGDADALLEIVLSFASKPSKFLRRLTLVIFESLTSRMTSNGLHSLTDILQVKETKAGQQELFETNGDVEMLDEGEDDEESQEESEGEMLDSDVEIVSASDTDSSDHESSGETSESESDSRSSDAESEDEDGETDVQDADLLALETSLATALGTRKFTQADMDASSSSDSDSDMTDSEMLDLDTKLAEVFRNRAETSNDNKKKEARSARENIVNFKNRVLDMIEIYMKSENINPLSLEVLLPLLQLARTTRTKQLADKVIRLLQTFYKRCSGLEKVPTLPPASSSATTNGKPSNPSVRHPKKRKLEQVVPEPAEDEQLLSARLTTTTTLRILHQIHAEAGLKNTSNAHRQACSRASILVVKSLLKAGIPLSDLEAVYEETKKRQDADEKCHVRDEFFEDWRNFLVNARGKLDERKQNTK